VPASGEFPLGTIAVVCSASDTAGNSGSGTGSVTVTDAEPPSIAECPADLFLQIPPGAQSWPVSWTDPLGADNCPELTVGCAPNSGDPFPPGVTLVVCAATDAAGLSSSCDFDVTLESQEIAEIPTLSRGPLATLGLLLAFSALFSLRRRRR
jgi:hypothetical protein